jgi:hypothetical protein
MGSFVGIGRNWPTKWFDHLNLGTNSVFNREMTASDSPCTIVPAE